MIGKPLRWILLVCLAWFVVPVRADKPTADELAFFESKIRPILVENCYECHSTDAEDIEGGLVLDSKWGWETGGDGGPAIVPGKVKDSLLVHAIDYKEDIISGMPPRSKLPDADIKLLKQWIEMGAPDPRAKVEGDRPLVEAFDLIKRYNEHWSWRPIQDPEPPKVSDGRWPLNDLDRFVLSRLEAVQLKPARPASKEVWLRRVYFDLIGLPPTLDQIDAFLRDESDSAYQTIVTGLLQSQRFGEKWARHWMDLVRYAETYGHEFDYPIPHPTEYRDYLIRAFNADVPYDQFVVEHIAGDMIDQPRRNPTEDFNESIIGTGFWYLHEATHAPTDVLKNEADIIDNQLDVFGKSFLGLTVACARCHDHKFDAISTADYYALSAFIQSSCRQLYPLDPGRKAEQAAKQLTDLLIQSRDLASSSSIVEKAASQEYAKAAGELLKSNPAPSVEAIGQVADQNGLQKTQLQRWVNVLRRGLEQPKLLTVASLLAKRFTDLSQLDAARKRISQETKRREHYEKENHMFADFRADELPAGWTRSGHAFQPTRGGVRFELSDSDVRSRTVDSAFFGDKAAGILRSPTFKLETNHIHVLARSAGQVNMNVIIDNYQMGPYNGLLFNGTFKRSPDTKGLWKWESFGGQLNKYLGHNAYLEFEDRGNGAIGIEEIWFSDGGVPPPSHSELIQAVAGDDTEFDRYWNQQLQSIAAGNDSELVNWLLDQKLVVLDELNPEFETRRKEARNIADRWPAARHVLAMAEGTRENGSVYVRGNPTMLGESVVPRGLTALGGQELSRLQLAKRIASPENPLTARVIANRIWHHLTGRGIVASVDDFGPQGQKPTHPQLLDYLASRLIEDGWSQKKLIERIVLSQTYRQSTLAASSTAKRVATADPTNALLHRMRVRRLPAESIRDAILATSGRLNSQPIRGSVATHRTPFMTGRGARGSGPLDGDGRRTIYLSVYRNFLNPFLMTFDMPSPFGPKGRRSNSNVPAQALTLLNDPFVVQQAKHWADLSSKEDGTPREKIDRMYRRAIGQELQQEQLDRLTAFYEKQFEANGEKQNAALSALAHAIFNMKSFYFLR